LPAAAYVCSRRRGASGSLPRVNRTEESKLINKKGKDLNLPRKISEKLQRFPKLQVHITSIVLSNSDRVVITNIDTKAVMCYDSVRKAAEALNCSPNTIRKYSAERKFLKKQIYQIILFPLVYPCGCIVCRSLLQQRCSCREDLPPPWANQAKK